MSGVVRIEFGKWVMDIAKYLATAVLISALFRDQDRSDIIIFGIPSVIFILAIGLFLIKEKESK